MVAQQHIEPEKPDGFQMFQPVPASDSYGRKKSVIDIKKHYQQQVIRQLIEKDAEVASQSIKLQS